VSVPAALVAAAVLVTAPPKTHDANPAPPEGSTSGEPTQDFAAAGLDAAAVERGLRARVGDELDRWSIRVDAQGAQHYRVDLRGPDGTQNTRELVLEGQTSEDRSRELASTLALIIEEAPREGSEDPRPSEGDDPELPLGFLVLEAHAGLGPPRNLDPDFGLGLAGGAWLVKDHLQPRGSVRWSHSWAGELTVHQISGRLGLAAGAPIPGAERFWLGALVMPAFKWTRAEQIRVATAWAGGGEASVLAQYRRDYLVVGLRTGIETTFPAPRASGSNATIRWGHLRWLLVLEIGLGF
jgi:hypothetical protein